MAVLALCLAAPSIAADEPQKLRWKELIPEEYRDKAIYQSPPADEQDVEAGSIAGMQQPSLGVRPELDGKRIRIPGFVVPLEYDDERRVTRFFLVPYFGACIHFPPPPPDQMLHVIPKKGIKVKSIYDPYEVMGTLRIEVHSTKVGVSEYTMRDAELEPYRP